MKADLFLSHATIVTAERIFPGGVGIKDGKVLRLIEGDEQVPAEEVHDIEGKLLLPGLVDDHVHFSTPGHDDWEGAMYGSFAAAAGGVTTALEMPFNADPPTRNAELLRSKREAVQSLSVIDMGLWGLLEDTNLAELEGMHTEGAIGFKAFLCDPNGQFGWPRSADLSTALQLSKRLGNVVSVHAENEELGKKYTEQIEKTGRKDRAAWGEAHPPVVELAAIREAIQAASETGGDLHIVHTTIPEGFAAIAQARERGVRVTGETCPHYLFFSSEDLVRIGPNAKCGPPLRSPQTVNALWQDVLAGRVDLIGSDHCPCLPDMKTAGQDDIWQAWGGISGIQTMLSVLLTEGVHKRGLPLTALVQLTSLNPARRFGLFPQKGHLGPGADADIVIVDLDKEWQFTQALNLSRHNLSPYLGCAFKGAVLRTYVRGSLVYNQNEILVQPGFGRIVRRNARPDPQDWQ